MTWANLENVDLRHAVLEEAQLYEAHLSGARADDAKLMKCHLEGSKLDEASLIRADLRGAYLIRASLVDTDISDAVLTGCYVHGISAWNTKGTPREQFNLVISRSYERYNEPVLTVDNLEVAQFVYLILVNQKIRDVIETITARAVLIFGRFQPDTKAILNMVREALRQRGYVPILFDFAPSPTRDLTETVQLLANMSKFVIADLSDPKSIPQELSTLIPFLPNVPVQPIIREGQREYGMFEHWRHYKWVLPEFIYRDKYHLSEHLDADVIGAAERYFHQDSSVVIDKKRARARSRTRCTELAPVSRSEYADPT